MKQFLFGAIFGVILVCINSFSPKIIEKEFKIYDYWENGNYYTADNLVKIKHLEEEGWQIKHVVSAGDRYRILTQVFLEREKR